MKKKQTKITHKLECDINNTDFVSFIAPKLNTAINELMNDAKLLEWLNNNTKI